MIDIRTLPGPFSVEMPEIYQIEISTVCNYKCVMCPRTLHERKEKVPFVEIDLVKKLIEEDSFEGSYFVELQQAGEPLLHPKLGEIVSLLKSTGILVGLSTNGSLIDKKIDELKEVDCITVSVDSLANYSDIRVNGDVQKLIANINLLLSIDDKKVILQVVEIGDWINAFFDIKNMFPGVQLRTVPLCFRGEYEEMSALPVKTDICMNPWLSVSIHTNGDVVPCCFSFWDDIIYGNLYKQNLREIWYKSPTIKILREEHERKNYNSFCAKCYMRSPFLIHQSILFENIRGKK